MNIFSVSKKKSFKMLTFFVVTFLFYSLTNIHASECEDNCKIAYPNDEKLQEKCEKDCKDLEKKAKVYEDILKINDKQQNALSNQLTYINQQKLENQKSLKKTTSELEDLSDKIKSLEKEISEKEKNIIYQRKILTNLIQSYYDYNKQGILEIVLLDKTILNSLTQEDYIQQSGIKIFDILDEIKTIQEELREKKQELDSSYEKSLKLKEKLQGEKDGLQKNERQKQSLLIQTQGEEKKYEDLLTRVEQQKMELFNFNSASNLDEVFDSVKNYPAPDKKYHAPTSWYFSQRDSRWGNQRMGNSSSLMKDYGCAVSSVAMIFRKLGSSIDPGKLAKEKIFYYDLIKWPSSWTPNIKLVSSVNHGNISWSKIDSSIKEGHPVIIYIKKTNGRGGHYVVITGKDKKDYIVHDPYFGANLYLGTSRSLVGKIGVSSNTIMDQMIIYN